MVDLTTNQQILVDCANIAWERVKTCWDVLKIYEDIPPDERSKSELYEMARNNVFEALLICERIKELDSTIPWESLGIFIRKD